MNDSEIKLNNYQILLSFVAILTVLTSILIIYNDTLKKEEKEPLFSDSTSYTISIINRIIIAFIFAAFLLINYYIYIKEKEKDDIDITPFSIQVIVSLITVIAALLSIYVVLISKPENEAELENPDI